MSLDCKSVLTLEKRPLVAELKLRSKRSLNLRHFEFQLLASKATENLNLLLMLLKLLISLICRVLTRRNPTKSYSLPSVNQLHALRYTVIHRHANDETGLHTKTCY